MGSSTSLRGLIATRPDRLGTSSGVGGFNGGLIAGGSNELVFTSDDVVCRELETALRRHRNLRFLTNTLPDFVVPQYLQCGSTDTTMPHVPHSFVTGFCSTTWDPCWIIGRVCCPIIVSFGCLCHIRCLLCCIFSTVLPFRCK